MDKLNREARVSASPAADDRRAGRCTENSRARGSGDSSRFAAADGAGVRQGRALRRARTVTLLAVFVAVIVSLAFDSGLGTPSSFGIGEFFLLCPLGGLEAFLASKAFLPVTAISLAVVLVLALLFGRGWCAWGCPVPPIRRFFKREPKFAGIGSGAGPNAEEAGRALSGCASCGSCASSAEGETAVADASDAGCVVETAPAAATSQPAGGEGRASSARSATGCAAVREQARSLWRARATHIGRDPRTWTLLAVLAAAFIAGFPLFCLVCPIGLTFGSVGSLWHLIVDKQVTLSVFVFPVALIVEIVLYRKWCMNLCPIAGLLNIAGQAAVLFRPRINEATCLREDGTPCTVCTAVCTERIDMHDADGAVQLGDCTRCGECARACPTASITFAILPEKDLREVSDKAFGRASDGVFDEAPERL